MSSPTPSSSQLSPAQARFVYWLSGLAPVATNVVTPLMVYWKLRHKDLTPLQKYNQQINEVVRQFVSGTIGLLSYFGGGELTRGLIGGVLNLRQQKMDDAPRHVAMIVGGVVASFIGFAFVRPILSMEVLCRFLKQEGGVSVNIPLAEAKRLARESAGPAAQIQALDRLYRQAVRREAGAKSTHWLVGPLLQKMDRHLLPNGAPLLGKTAHWATVALTAYLGLWTALLWSVNRLSGSKSNRLPVSRVLPGAVSVAPGFRGPLNGPRLPANFSGLSGFNVRGVAPYPPQVSPFRR